MVATDVAPDAGSGAPGGSVPGRPFVAFASLWAGVALALAALVSSLRPDLLMPTVGAVSALWIGVMTVVVLVRRPYLTPWIVVPLFSFAGELRLRVSPLFSVTKDAVVASLIALAILTGLRFGRGIMTRVRPIQVSLACWVVLVVLYVVNVSGSHGASWLFGARLFVSAVILFAAGLLVPQPWRSVESLVRATAAVLVVEAVFAWVQHLVGEDRLVYQWGYAYGSQVRVTTGGSLRTSGTFEDPFQLAALAVLGLVLAAFVARPLLSSVLVVSSLAVLGATAVRTSELAAFGILGLVLVRRGYWKQLCVLALPAVAAIVLFLATTSSAVSPGQPERPLLYTLNGRSTAWSQAVTGWGSIVYGNGVGARGIGSTRTSTTVSDAPAYDPDAAPTADYAGSTAFLDSAYAQVLSDVGLVGVLALVGGMGGLLLNAVRRAWQEPDNDPAWATSALGLTMVLDWIGRASLASFTTGYLTMFALGLLAARMFSRAAVREKAADEGAEERAGSG